jgi:hypothetical protein
MPPKKPNATPLFWALASLIAIMVAVAVPLVLVLAPNMILSGLVAPYYYIVLVALGCAAALLLFGALRGGYPRWKGHALSGTLEIGGPIAVAALTVVGGYFFRPEPSASLVVRVHGAGGRTELLCPTSVKLFLGQDVRDGEIGRNCQAQFNEVPSRLLTTAGLFVQATVPGYEQADRKALPVPNDRVLWVTMRRIAERSTAWGHLVYSRTKGPVSGALISIDGGLCEGKTNSAGQFRFEVPLPEGRTVRLTALVGGRIVFDDRVTLPIAGTLTAREVP